MAGFVDLSTVPAIAISPEAKEMISYRLNTRRFLGSRGVLWRRDWRGFADVCDIPQEIIPSFASKVDKLDQILQYILKSRNFTVEDLIFNLNKIKRFDIIQDTISYLERDAESYLQRRRQSEKNVEKNNFPLDNLILTLDDQFRVERGESIQHFNAFLLYADEDESFANEVVDHLETKNNLKLCLKERDLIAGISFEHTAIMRIISERCDRLITIISPEFLESPANTFFLNFAQANGIGKNQQRKIIPCIYKNCELPSQLAYYTKIYYKPSTANFFWKKLVTSMKPTYMIESASVCEKKKLLEEEKAINLEPKQISCSGEESTSSESTQQYLPLDGLNSLPDTPKSEIKKKKWKPFKKVKKALLAK